MEAFKNSLIAGLSLALMVFYFSCSARADARLSELIFEDCSKALDHTSTIVTADQPAAVESLIHVLELKAELPPAAEGSLPTQSGSFPALDPMRSSLWRSFDPDREIKAKDCAIALLERLRPYSILALPQLVEISRDQAVSDELRYRSVRASVLIAQSHDGKVSGSLVDRLFQLMNGESFESARNLLTLLPRETVIKQGISALSNGDEARRDRIIRFLKIIGPEEMLRLHVEELDAAQPPLKQFSIPLRGGLGASAENVKVLLQDSRVPELKNGAATALLEISKQKPKALCANEGLCSREMTELVDLVLQSINSSAPSFREMHAALYNLAPALPHFSRSLLKAIKAKSTQIGYTTALLSLIGAVEDNVLFYSSVVPFMFEGPVELRVEAIEALTSIKSKRRDLLSQFLRLLKQNAKESDPETKRQITLAVVSAIPSLAELGDTYRLLPFVELSLQYSLSEGEHPATKGLSAIGTASYPLILSHLEGPIEPKRIVARALLAMPLSESRIARGLLPALADKDKEVSDSVFRTLLAGGKVAIAPLKDALTSEDSLLSLRAASLLAHLNSASPKVLEILERGLTASTCQEKLEASEALVLTADFDRNMLSAEAIKCLTSSPEDQQEALALLRNMSAISISIPEISEQLRPENPNLGVYLGLMMLIGEEPRFTKQLRDIARNKDLSQPLRCQGFHAASRLHALQDPDFQQLAWDMFKESGYVCFADAPPERVLGALMASHTSLSKAELPRFLRLIGDYGLKASHLENVISPYAEHPDDNVRYEAVVTLIKITNDPKSRLPAVRRLAESPSNDRIIEEKFSSDVSALFKELGVSAENELQRFVSDSWFASHPV